MTKVSTRAEHHIKLTEKAWWEKYGHLVERIWTYDDYLTKIVRHNYIAEMQDFLFKPGGRLLDFGCGTGWLSLPLALRGMAVDGVDFSEVQINRARRQAQALGLVNTRYWCADHVFKENYYDSVLLHAVLHHIPPEQRRSFLESISNALVPGGRLYLYEPVAATPGPPWQAWIADRFLGGVFKILYWIACKGGFYEPEIATAMQDGWTMRSPEEQPTQLGELINLISSFLKVVRISPWHCWSIGYANFCMSLQPVWRQRFERAAPWFYSLDSKVRSTAWYHYLRSWPLVAILAQKNG